MNAQGEIKLSMEVNKMLLIYVILKITAVLKEFKINVRLQKLLHDGKVGVMYKYDRTC